MLYCWSFKKNIWCLLHLYFKSLKPHYVKLAGEGNGSAQRWKIQDALKTPGRASYHPPPSAERGRTGDQREATLLFKLYSSLSLGLDTFFSSDYTFSPRASYKSYDHYCVQLFKNSTTSNKDGKEPDHSILISHAFFWTGLEMQFSRTERLGKNPPWS